jgi:hypothetical protein
MPKQLLTEGVWSACDFPASSPMERQPLHLYTLLARGDLQWITSAHIHWPDVGEEAAESGVWCPQDGEVSERDMGLSGMATHARAGRGEFCPPVLIGHSGILFSVDGHRCSHPCSEQSPLLDLCAPGYGVITERNSISASGTPHNHWRLAVKRRGAARERALLSARLIGSFLTHARCSDRGNWEVLQERELSNIHKQIVYIYKKKTHCEIFISAAVATTLSGGQRRAQGTATGCLRKGRPRDLLRERAALWWQSPSHQKLLVTKTQRRRLQLSDDPLRRPIPSRAVQRSHAMIPGVHWSGSPLPCWFSPPIHLHQPQLAKNPTSRLFLFPDSLSPFEQLFHLRAGLLQYVGSTQEYQDAKSKNASPSIWTMARGKACSVSGGSVMSVFPHGGDDDRGDM